MEHVGLAREYRLLTVDKKQGDLEDGSRNCQVLAVCRGNRCKEIPCLWQGVRGKEQAGILVSKSLTLPSNFHPKQEELFDDFPCTQKKSGLSSLAHCVIVTKEFFFL